MSRTPAQALAWAQSNTTWPYGQCLGWVRSCYGAGSYYSSAAVAYAAARYKHTTFPPPPGVPLWWTGGSHGYGHVAISAGDGYCYSTDILHTGHVNRIPIELVHSAWGQTYRGWSEDINGVHVYVPSATPSVPGVDLSNVLAAFHADPSRAQGSGTHESDVYRVEAALKAEGLLSSSYASDGYAGTSTKTAYQAWQRRCGYSGSGADGYPGASSLGKLGARHGFRVVS